MFEAKELDINPRKPFYFTVGALSVFALCTVGYFWYQLQPRNNFKTPPPSTQPAAPPVASAPAALAAAPAAANVEPAAPGTGASTRTTPLGSELALSANPKLPQSAASSFRTSPNAGAAPTAVGVGRGARPPQQSAAPGGTVFSAEAGPAVSATAAERREAAVTITPASTQLDPVIEAAYQAFTAGDLGLARSNYQQALRSSPANRDALLGLAAVEIRAKRYDAADAYYTRLLEIDPRDTHAQAGLINLRGQVDPLSTESRLKNMISAQPDAGFLHFTLGNQLAAQARWAEAQQAYFKAFSGEPDNPDYAFNLAVSLDQLHQVKPALDYYRRALALAEGRQASFDKAQASKRISQLNR